VLLATLRSKPNFIKFSWEMPGCGCHGQTNLNASFDGLSTFAPGGASRIPNGSDTNSVSDWRRNSFNYPLNMPVGGEAFNTPSTTNRQMDVSGCGPLS
jgi:hypothetical protein